MPTPTYRSGFGGTVTINGTELSVIRWSINPTATIVEFRNSKSGNHPIRQATYTDAAASIEIDWSDSDQPFATAANMVPGTVLTNVILLIDKTSALGWTLTSMIVTNTPQSTDRAGKVSTQVQVAMNGGTITPPAGTAY